MVKFFQSTSVAYYRDKQNPEKGRNKKNNPKHYLMHMRKSRGLGSESLVVSLGKALNGIASTFE